MTPDAPRKLNGGKIKGNIVEAKSNYCFVHFLHNGQKYSLFLHKNFFKKPPDKFKNGAKVLGLIKFEKDKAQLKYPKIGLDYYLYYFSKLGEKND